MCHVGSYYRPGFVSTYTYYRILFRIRDVLRYINCNFLCEDDVTTESVRKNTGPDLLFLLLVWSYRRLVKSTRLETNSVSQSVARRMSTLHH